MSNCQYQKLKTQDLVTNINITITVLSIYYYYYQFTSIFFMKGKQENSSSFHKSHRSEEDQSNHSTLTDLITKEQFQSFHDHNHEQIQNSSIIQNQLEINAIIDYGVTNNTKNGWFFTGNISNNPKIFIVDNQIRSLLTVCQFGNPQVTIDVIMTQKAIKINKIVKKDQIYQFINGKINVNPSNKIFVIIDEHSKIINLDNRNTKSKRNEKFRNKITSNCIHSNALFTINDLLKQIPAQLRQGWYFIGYLLDYPQPIIFGDQIYSMLQVCEISDRQTRIKVILTEQSLRIYHQILCPNQKYLFMNGVLNVGHNKNFITINEYSKIMCANFLHGQQRNDSANFVCQSALISSSQIISNKNIYSNAQLVTKSQKLSNQQRF